MTGRWGDTPWLCPTDQGKLYEERHLRRVFHPILQQANLPSFRVYDLRHTYASLLLSAGVPLLYVSQQLVHTNPDTSLRYYARWIPTGDQRYIDILDTAAEKTRHQTLAPESTKYQKPLISGLPHHRRPMMMNQQPLVPDTLEEICG